MPLGSPSRFYRGEAARFLCNRLALCLRLSFRSIAPCGRCACGRLRRLSQDSKSRLLALVPGQRLFDLRNLGRGRQHPARLHQRKMDIAYSRPFGQIDLRESPSYSHDLQPCSEFHFLLPSPVLRHLFRLFQSVLPTSQRKKGEGQQTLPL